jgi:ribosome recycling factor
MVNDILDKAKQTMEKSIEALKKDFTSLRTGKVSTKIVEAITIDYYGTPTPLNGVGSIATPDANTISITPWEKNLVGDIEKAIAAANIGVNPNNNGDSVILNFPPMTSEQRQETVKQAKGMAEKAKVSVRNNRQDANNKVKKLEKDKEITEDESKQGQDKVQKLTDEYIKKVDDTLKTKEQDILKV